MKKSLAHISALAALFLFLSCSGGEKPIPVTGISLNKATLSLYVDAQETLIPTIQPDTATNKNVSWASTNTAIASVGNGTVTAKATGTSTITATTQDGGRTATCLVTVSERPVPATGVTLNKTSTSIAVGASETLVATVQPENATNKAVNWTTSNYLIASVSNGAVTGVNPGTATIKATTASGNHSASCTVTVVQPVTSVTLNKNLLALQTGGTERLTAIVLPSSATNKTIIWTSSNAYVATVNSSGQVTAQSRGTATITAASQDGNKTATCSVTVANVYVAGHRTVNGKHVATLWTNKQAQSLSNGSYDAVAESVYVTDSYTYVAGYEQNASGKFVAKVWRNGGLYQNLSDGTYDAAAYSICVSSSNVYVAGIEYNSQGRPVATLWTNGTAKHLADDTYSSYAYSVTTSGSSVYVAGEYRNNSRQVAVCWENDELWILGNEASNSVGSGIAVANGRVYVAGTEVTASNMRNAVLWTDGNYRRISDGKAMAIAYGISVSGGDVYVCGGYQTYSVSSYIFPMVWKNGEAQTLSPGLSLTVGGNARSVFALGGSVFAAGVQRDYSDKDYAFLWVNGAAESLGGLGEGRGIFVR